MNSVDRFKRRRKLRLLQRGFRLDEWKESDHPRDENGRFSSGGGGSNSPFTEDAFSNERKKNAIRHSLDDVSTDEFDARYFKDDLSKEELSAVETYTGSNYRVINNALREESGVSNRHERVIDNLTNAIDRHELEEDTYLKRGVSGLSAFGLANQNWDFRVKSEDKELKQRDVDEIADKLVGEVFTDDGFMSTDTAPDLLPVGDSAVVMNIYAPKGTKAMYVAPISEVPGERETIVQRGTSYRVTGVRLNKNKKSTLKDGYGGIVIDVEIVGQNPKAGKKNSHGMKTYNGKRRK